MRSAAPQKLRSGKALRKSVMKALMSSRPRRGSCSEYWRSISGAASSSTIPRSHVSPQNLVNQRPMMALFLSSLDMLYLLFASSSQLTIGLIDAMDLGAETCGLPPDFRAVRRAARAAAVYKRRKQPLQLGKRVQCAFCTRGMRWCLRAAVAELPDGNAELPCLVSLVLLNAGAGEHHDA